ncbi:hypothetical protein [Corynebacterium sp. H113]|uniref:hypothetical protein n=1 Tax=Corynebacterium sp. H113 TaxID=3133419 RepID=UPI00309DF941
MTVSVARLRLEYRQLRARLTHKGSVERLRVFGYRPDTIEDMLGDTARPDDPWPRVPGGHDDYA